MDLAKKHIKLIQQLLKLSNLDVGSVDGVLGAKTKAAINSIVEVDYQLNIKRKLIAYLQLESNKRGINAGVIDGYWGPQTDYAYEVLYQLIMNNIDETNWRDTDIEIANPNNWPLQNDDELNDFYGQIGENQKRIILPYPHKLSWDKRIVIKSYFCHEKVSSSLEIVLSNVLKHYGLDEIKRLKLDVWGGCLNVRKMRGGNKWSTHSWGIALDYNPDDNRLKWGRDRAGFASNDYDKWWQIWEEEGWLSLGRTKNYDWMHIQATSVL